MRVSLIRGSAFVFLVWTVKIWGELKSIELILSDKKSEDMKVLFISLNVTTKADAIKQSIKNFAAMEKQKKDR